MVGENQTVTSDGGVFGLVKKSGEVTIRSSVQDSRGRWSDTKDTTVNFLKYFGPKAFFTAERSGSARTTLTVIRTAQIAPLTVGGKQLNKMTITFKTRPMGSDTWTTNNGSASGVWTTQSELTASAANLAGTFAGTQSWEVMMIVEDLFTTASYSYPVSTDKVLVSKTKDGIGIGKIREHGALDVAGEIYANNKPIQHHQLTANNGTAIMLPDGTDLNTVTEGGYYNCGSFLHAPSGSGANGWMYIRVTKHTNNNGWALQEAIDFNGVVGDWQYYAVQNKVAEFTAVNQTKVYKTTIRGPYGLNANATRCGNIVNLSINLVYTKAHKVSGKAAETIPVGWRPTTAQIITLTGHAGGGTGTQNWTDSFADLHYETDGGINFTIITKAQPLGMMGSITWITTDPFPS